MDSGSLSERDPSRHPLSDPYDNDPTGAFELGEDTIRILRKEYIFYVNDTTRGLPHRGVNFVDPIGLVLIVLPYVAILSLFKPAAKVSLIRVRRDWTGKAEILQREVLPRGLDPELMKVELAEKVRSGAFD